MARSIISLDSDSINSGSHTQEFKNQGESQEDSNIRWINIIFIPFHPVFKFLILVTVVLKCCLGPMTSINNFITCSQTSDFNIYLLYLLDYYQYFGNIVYIIDIFLHLLHRQVEDEARKREFMPKSALLIILDILSVIPFFEMAAGVTCPRPRVWPNILAFTEVLLIYRVVEYFSLHTTHSIFKITVGYSITIFLIVNAVTCLFMLMTLGGLCDSCISKKNNYDWRQKFARRDHSIYNSTMAIYLYAFEYVLGYTIRRLTDSDDPLTMSNFIFTIFIMIFGYILWTFVITPKLFNEFVLKIKQTHLFNDRASNVIEETKRRNPRPAAYKDVENFYSVTWAKQTGIIRAPSLLNKIPRHLKLSIVQDLSWVVFFHSPTFRKCSSAYKRWLCENINLEYKMAGERFFSGLRCYTNLYYLKSGVVQLFARDDSSSPMLSVTGGTIFGDVSAIVPPIFRKAVVHCLTYCELFVISRSTILRSLHKFPEDRRNILRSVRERMKHARELYTLKSLARKVETLDDEEGINWIKKRWWEISDALMSFKRSRREKRFAVSAEEKDYHCAKYIGQLVLCKKNQLQENSMFMRDQYIWLLSSDSKFFVIWNYIVIVTVWATMLVLPPSIVRMTLDRPQWYSYFLNTVNFIYAADVFVMLMTAPEQGENTMQTISSVAVYRFKNIYFLLDVLSCSWIDYFLKGIGNTELSKIIVFNRLLKSYLLFYNRRKSYWNRYVSFKSKTLYNIAVVYMIVVYVTAFLMYMLSLQFPQITRDNYFKMHCITVNHTKCIFNNSGVRAFPLVYTYRLFAESGRLLSKSKVDTSLDIIGNFMLYGLFVWTRMYFVSGLYLKFRYVVGYQYYVRLLKSYYTENNIHPELMKRMANYFICHWKYMRGADVMEQYKHQDDPTYIYWNARGEVAENTIKNSELFKGADPLLIRELAQKAEYLILPPNSTYIVFGVHVNQINWLITGSMKCEYRDEKNEVIKSQVEKGSILGVLSVMVGNASIRTYTTTTDCELLFLTHHLFLNSLKRYPLDYSYFETCKKELKPLYDEMVEDYLLEHEDYRTVLRKRVFHGGIMSQSLLNIHKKLTSSSSHVNLTRSQSKQNIHAKPSFKYKIVRFFKDFRRNPESSLIRIWILIRTITAMVTMVVFSLRTSNFVSKESALKALAVNIGYLDMIIKLFLPYYNEDGIVVSSIKKTVWHYLNGSFLIDIVGNTDLIPSLHLFYDPDKRTNLLVQASCKFSQLYIVISVFNYAADSPTVNIGTMIMAKWYIVSVLVMFYVSNFFYMRCIIYQDKEFKYAVKKDNCWMPTHLRLNKVPTNLEFRLMFLQSLSLIQYMFMKIPSSIWLVGEDNMIYYTVSFVTICFIFWFYYCETQSYTILNYRTNSVFNRNVSKLQEFLKEERVPKDVIQTVMNYYNYYWTRTKGLDMNKNTRIGVIFRQDLCNYFHTRTLQTVTDLLNGNETLQGQLAAQVSELFLLENQDVMREMDLTPHVFIVNRGKVIITKEGKRKATLTKGAIFGNMKSSLVRPTRCTATTLESTDLFYLTVREFHQIIQMNQDAVKKIAESPQTKDDYLPTPKPVEEEHTNTIKYLLRAQVNTMKIPKTSKYYSAEKHGWYNMMTLLSWFPLAVITTAVTVMVGVLVEVEEPETNRFLLPIPWQMSIAFAVLDLFYIFYLVSEILQVRLVVGRNGLVHSYTWMEKLKNPWLHIEILSLLVPFLAYITHNWLYHLVRMVRIRTVHKAHRYFCKNNTQYKYMAAIVKITMFLLLLHILTCGWITVACRAPLFDHLDYSKETFDYIFLTFYDPKWYIINTTHPGRCGCAVTTIQYIDPKIDQYSRAFIFVKNRKADYIVSFYMVVCILIWVNSDAIVPTTLASITYRIIMTKILYIVDVYIGSMAISAIYTKYREKHLHDYNLNNLLLYMSNNGLSPILISAVEDNIAQLWEKQKSCLIPNISTHAPLCLREDMMLSLFGHHLDSPFLFEMLPPYFKRQLATRLDRVVISPGKNIVKEGDMYPCIFFIHEGEVEKWYNDPNSGESKMISLLKTNGYFGLIPGLFPNTPYQFSFYTRTVVDLVFLKFQDWQDLLSGYPEVKVELYTAALSIVR